MFNLAFVLNLNLLVQNFFGFGMYHFIKTVGWYRVVKDNNCNVFAKMLILCLERFSDGSKHTAFW